MFQKSTKLKWVLSSFLIYGWSIIQAVACNTTPIGCSGYKTYTQGAWGASCSGYNAASLLQNNFAAVFPNGVEIGCTNKLVFTSSTAVRNYLPQGGTASALASGVKTNQLSGGGVFGGQLLALAINIKMDQAISGFASASGNLKDLVITSGNFKNWTVLQFFEEANKKIGGCSAANFTFSQYSDVAALINENYDNGTVNKGYLNCPPIVASGVVTNVSCKCGNNGAITLTVSGGFPPYTFKWNNGSTSQNRTNLTAGSYSVTIKDKIGQSVSLNFTVTQPSSALMASTNGGVTNVSYYGGSNGKVVLTVSGGTAPYTYLWNNGATTKDLTNVPAGMYKVTITDAKGCKAYACATVCQPNPPVCNISASASKTDVKCNGGATGSVVLTVNGGTAPITYLWSNGATTKDLTNVVAGSYTVIVKDKNNCTATASATVNQPDPLATSAVSKAATCNNSSTGSVTLTVTGGTSPYSFAWSNGATSQNLSNVPAGTYSVTVTDSKGCTKSESAVVEQPDAMVATVGEVVNVKCYGASTGSISIYSVAGGNGDYTFLWSNGATTQDLTGVPAGTYSVTVKDSKGCTTTASATIGQPNAALSASAANTDVKCYGESNGSVNLTVTGGTEPYSFAWSNGATSEDLSNVAAGSYSVSVTDANGCTTTSSATVGQPSAGLSASSMGGVVNVKCFGGSTGSVDLTVSGGTMPYTYEWSNGATTEDLSDLVAGTYSVLVTDKNGCTTTTSATVEQAGELTLTGTKTNSTICSCNGKAKAEAMGGTPPYSYAWSNGMTGEEITGLCALPALSVTVTDANGCTKTYDLGPISQKEGCTAVEVVSFAQGLRQDFTKVDANRSVGSAMFGAPENTDVLGTFYSLGFGGWAILRVDGSIIDKPGADLKVVETTWHTWDCDRYTERARVEVSQDNVTWYDKGIICQDAEIDISPLPCISYVRITDVSDRADFVNELPLADGFDVDGIICLQPSNNGRRGVDQTSATVVKEVKQTLARKVEMYPNPADNQLFVNILGAERGESLTLTVVDHMGRVVKVMDITAVGAGHREEVNMNDLKAGVYMVRVTGSEMNFTKKIVKK